jgi:GPCR-Autoproteolysis INducing (GAIN) domain
VSDKYLQSALDTGNGLLQERHNESWRDMAPRERQRTASKLLRFVESSAFQYAESMSLSAGQTSLNITDNIGQCAMNLLLKFL